MNGATELELQQIAEADAVIVSARKERRKILHRIRQRGYLKPRREK